MSDTPRTDAETYVWEKGRENPFVHKEFAQQLEMELTEKTNEVARLRKENNEFLLSEAALAEELKISDDWLRHTRNEVARLRQALELIACPERPDGTYNRDRRACELLAKDALKAEIK
jgi:hypothetical protein